LLFYVSTLSNLYNKLVGTLFFFFNTKISIYLKRSKCKKKTRAKNYTTPDISLLKYIKQEVG
jgi:hypothetical protein